MKRTEELQPLSHDHFQGLTVAQRIRRGLEKEADAATIAAYAAHFGEAHLQHHFQQEEELLVGMLEEINEELAARMKQEHEELMTLTDLLDKEQVEQRTLVQFAQALTAHIRFEEREVFPLLEQRLDAESLRRIGRSLHESHVTRTGCDPPFWT